MPTPSEVQTCIDNLSASSQPIDFTLLAAETNNANTGVSFTVVTVNDLPDLETSNIGVGQIVFVESIGVPVVSTENEWRGLDGRLLRRDFIIGRLFSWGSNSCGKLGDGTVTSRCSPVREFSSATDWCQVSATACHAAAIKMSGELWAWGPNICGRLGDGTTVTRCSQVREFSSATDWCSVSVGHVHTAAVKTLGEIWSWGLNTCGQLGVGNILGSRCSPVREFCSATDWCQVSAGECYTAAIKTSGQIWAWGVNSFGRLGDGTATTRCSPVREFCSATDWCQLSAGSAGTIAIKTSGELWAWGFNSCGQLGDGTVTSRCSPVREICSATDWCQVSGGGHHTAAIKTSGELWAWGCGACGQLGDGTVTNRCSPVRERCSATDWCQVSVGRLCHTAAIKTSGELWAWGFGACGVLGNGTTAIRCSPVREFCSLTDWCQVSMGLFHTAAIQTS